MSNVFDSSEAFTQSSISSDANEPIVSAAGGTEAGATGPSTPTERENLTIKSQRTRTVRRTRKRLRVARKALPEIITESDFKVLH